MLNVINIPNFLTLLRLIAIPVFLILLENLQYREALAVFIGAGLTDALDGAIARLTNTKTTLGAYLDPAADKLLLVSAFIALGFMHEVPRWLVVLVISRDVMIVLGYFLLFMLTSETMEIHPTVSGKLSTFLQLLSVTIVLVSHIRSGLPSEAGRQIIFALTGAVSALAGLQYMYRGMVWIQSHDETLRPPSQGASGKQRKSEDSRRRA